MTTSEHIDITSPSHDMEKKRAAVLVPMAMTA